MFISSNFPRQCRKNVLCKIFVQLSRSGDFSRVLKMCVLPFIIIFNFCIKLGASHIFVCNCTLYHLYISLRVHCMPQLLSFIIIFLFFFLCRCQVWSLPSLSQPPSIPYFLSFCNHFCPDTFSPFTHQGRPSYSVDYFTPTLTYCEVCVPACVCVCVWFGARAQ